MKHPGWYGRYLNAQLAEIIALYSPKPNSCQFGIIENYFVFSISYG